MVGGVEEGVVVPVVKKGDVGKVSDYRGVTRTQTAYKIYATVLAERLRKEMEGKGFYHRVDLDSGKGRELWITFMLFIF